MRQILITGVFGLLLTSALAGADASTDPHIGYLYPAGGQRGTVVQIIAGGQYLRGAFNVHVSGDGVQAKVLDYMPAIRNLNTDQRKLLQERIQQVRQRRQAEADGKPIPAPDKEADAKPQAEAVKLPKNPLWYDLENKSLRELAHLAAILQIPRQKIIFNRQISESVLIEITIDPKADLGRRELRVFTSGGLTNPMVFEVGGLTETRELEPNGERKTFLPAFENLPEDEPLDLPVMINGQIMPGDVDRFRFHAEKDQQLVISAQARTLIPYLADAVPGWFEALLTLYAPDGTEIASADCYRFEPDPVLFYTVSQTGVYTIQVRDSIYRGREDFVYRVSVGRLPFVTSIFPLGAAANTNASVAVEGWNLPTKKLNLDTRPAGVPIAETACNAEQQSSNPVLYAIDDLPECSETKANNTPAAAQRIQMPVIVNGRIETPDDIDVFRIDGRKGQQVILEVCARRVQSPLDALLRLTDADGSVVAWNDDAQDMGDEFLFKDISGLQTHHADACLTAELPADGAYYVHLSDAQHHGGPEYGYRLRLSEPRPDFALRMTPSSLSPYQGGSTKFTVFVLPQDGFSGDIDIVLKDAPKGFILKGGPLKAGTDQVQMTLMAPRTFQNQPVTLHLEGRAKIGDRTLIRPVVPADDVMQAFLYRHLVPARELVVAVRKPARRPTASR